MNLMLPSMRRRATSIRSARCATLRRSSRSSSSGVLALTGSAISPSSSFSPDSPVVFAADSSATAAAGLVSPASAPASAASLAALSSKASCTSFSAALMAPSPFSNSSWHLLSSTLLKVIFLGSASASPVATEFGSINSTWSAKKRSFRAAHIMAYSSANVGSVSALSKICAIRPISVTASLMPSSSTSSMSFSKFSGVSLFRMDLNARCFLSSSSNLVLSMPPTTNLFSICINAGSLGSLRVLTGWP
mmetsp:Transcript_30073/g.48349  ORF Transcript_30073/g.48349 Transcript_30073/m.48349 type:complete len:248 (-) Transcript_30073:8-751(-)